MTGFRKFSGVLLAGLIVAGPLLGAPVKIFAASSLKTALDEVISQGALDAIAVYGGSAAIARQVAQGAEADIVILAHPDWMDWLGERNLLAEQSRCDLVANALVLAGAADSADLELSSANHLIAALAGGRLAVGELRSVPAGQYAAAYLTGQGWLDDLRPHMAQTSNVRLALALIARGEVPLGFVYASDVSAQPEVRAVFVPPADSYPPIRYPMALTGSADEAAMIAYKVLSGASDVFMRNGFAEVPQGDRERCAQ